MQYGHIVMEHVSLFTAHRGLLPFVSTLSSDNRFIEHVSLSFR